MDANICTHSSQCEGWIVIGGPYSKCACIVHDGCPLAENLIFIILVLVTYVSVLTCRPFMFFTHPASYTGFFCANLKY